MKTKQYNVIPRLLFLGVITAIITSYATVPELNARQQNEYRTTVKINVDADRTLRTGLINYLESGLLSLGYVRIVEDKPDWQISLVADDIGGGDIQTNTVVVSLLVSKPFDNDLFSFLVNKQYKDIFLTSSENLHELKSQVLYTGKMRELRMLSDKIVNYFKTRYLEKEKAEFDITDRNLERLGQ